MNINTLLKVIDADQELQIEYRHETVFRGKPDDFNLETEYGHLEVKCLWHSDFYDALMIEI